MPRARCARWLAALALVVAVVPIVSGGRAHGDPIDDKRAEAKSLQNQIDAGGAQLDALSERYNGAQYRLEQAEAAAADAQQKLDAAEAEVARLSDLVKQRAAALYRGVGQGGPVNLDVSSASRLISSSKYSKSAAQHDIDLVKQLRSAQRALQNQKAAAEQAQADARDEQAQIGQAQAAVEAANARQEQLLSQVNGEIAQLVAEEQARKEAAALAEAQQRYAAAAAAAPAPTGVPAPAPTGAPAPAPTGAPAPGPSRSSGGGSGPVNPNVPVNGGGAAAAIAYARAQLGKPYCYAGAGPACFDCSGLTMRAWGAAGVSMPHYSGAQYSMFPHVPLNAMQPGDLVFWGPGGSDHVGLYIGGGQMIAAPHTGDVVKIQAVYGSPVGAARPG
ncbi:MAG TPA: C40 family peptidase [Acidimicrobiia bacterium]|nr:C40 family peptidase [Acidimicrobiia bacterium]